MTEATEATEATKPLILNLGCGRNPIAGMVNVDQQAGEGVDLVVDLEAGAWPWDNDEVDAIFGLHVIEHVADPLRFMQEAWRVVKADGTITLACPYGSSDDAWENPDHRRPYFLRSWEFFGQPNYWREGSYGYTADWKVEGVELRMTEEQFEEWFDDQGLDIRKDPAANVIAIISQYRNVVSEQVATLRCVKPARAADRALQESLPVAFSVLVPVGDGRTNRVVSAEDYENDREDEV